MDYEVKADPLEAVLEGGTAELPVLRPVLWGDPHNRSCAGGVCERVSAARVGGRVEKPFGRCGGGSRLCHRIADCSAYRPHDIRRQAARGPEADRTGYPDIELWQRNSRDLWCDACRRDGYLGDRLYRAAKQEQMRQGQAISDQLDRAKTSNKERLI